MYKVITITSLAIIICFGLYTLTRKDATHINLDTEIKASSQENNTEPNNFNEEIAVTTTNKQENIPLAQPGLITSVTKQGADRWELVIDILSHNNNWTPGGESTGSFFINKNPKLRYLTVTESTKSYQCGDGPDGNATTPDILIPNSDFLELIKEYATAYFSITKTNILAMYQQCLP